jgi:hypothetical protein
MTTVVSATGATFGKYDPRGHIKATKVGVSPLEDADTASRDDFHVCRRGMTDLGDGKGVSFWKINGRYHTHNTHPLLRRGPLSRRRNSWPGHLRSVPRRCSWLDNSCGLRCGVRRGVALACMLVLGAFAFDMRLHFF